MDEQVLVRFKKLHGAKSYMIMKSADPITPTSWTFGGTSAKTSITVSGLTSFTRTWFRVQGVGAIGGGDWSDPAWCVIT